MTFIIEYPSKLTPNNKDIVIFVSSLSQLKNSEFLPDSKFYLKSNQFIKQINNNNNFFLQNIKKNNSLLNIMIILVREVNKSKISLGSQIYSNFFNSNKKLSKNLTFIFSKTLISKNKKLISDVILGFALRCYSFNKYKTKKNNNSSITLNLYKLPLLKEIKYKLNLFESINFTKDLVSEPANTLNPISFSDKCLKLKKLGLKVKIFDKKQLEKIGMRSLLGVAQGSINEPRVVMLEWNTKKNSKPIVLVGKGVTFDSGGISLKPSGGMEEMITDMSGSAVVVGSMMNAALNRSSKSLIGIIGLVENMPDGEAQRPGDIVKSLSGQTIEVLNTDAEGRLVLADLLTYIQNKFKPKQIIDFATLTGAIMIALGTHRAGLFSNNDTLSKNLFKAGEITGEKLWRMPLGDEYDNEINSLRADMKNIGSTRFGGSTQAAQFIQRFIKDNTAWAHLDIAGVSWSLKGGNNIHSNLHPPGATAFGVRLIDEFLKGN